jgi:hypothetical protein
VNLMASTHIPCPNKQVQILLTAIQIIFIHGRIVGQRFLEGIKRKFEIPAEVPIGVVA